MISFCFMMYIFAYAIVPVWVYMWYIWVYIRSCVFLSKIVKRIFGHADIPHCYTQSNNL